MRRYFKTYNRARSFFSQIDSYVITFTKINIDSKECFGYVDGNQRIFKDEIYSAEQVLDIVFSDLSLVEITEEEHNLIVGS